MGQTIGKQQDIRLNILKQWSGLRNCTILFDSDQDGDGSQNVVRNILLNKKNIFCIHFDDHDNVYGGYISTKITKSRISIKDKNSFVFSLISKGITNINQYKINKEVNDLSFYLYSNNKYQHLYQFGVDCIVVNRVGGTKSYCSNSCYEFNNKMNPLTDHFLHNFTIQRVIIIQMN
ncbi:TLDc domain-containing protein [Entamoeba marina]